MLVVFIHLSFTSNVAQVNFSQCLFLTEVFPHWFLTNYELFDETDNLCYYILLQMSILCQLSFQYHLYAWWGREVFTHITIHCRFSISETEWNTLSFQFQPALNTSNDIGYVEDKLWNWVFSSISTSFQWDKNRAHHVRDTKSALVFVWWSSLTIKLAHHVIQELAGHQS